MKFEVEVIDGDVYVDGEFVSQLCWTNESIGYAVAQWLNEKEEENKE